ncbi:MAG: Rieske (2Fe-2S) protein [candidate division Zixibacteria bacterium]|nr:Rieske (2Fe-2S) protein [candidate division Zixibacteria bacterium]
MPINDEKPNESRRSFMGKFTIGVFSIGILGQGWTYLRALVPNILYEPPVRFKVGLPEEFSEGVNFISSRQVFVIKDGSQYSCISAKCTHLGCTVKYIPLDHEQSVKIRGKEVQVKSEFNCPCHGSKFRQDGSPYSGPAPGALPWFKIDIAPEDGQLVVDVSAPVDSNFRLKV